MKIAGKTHFFLKYWLIFQQPMRVPSFFLYHVVDPCVVFEAALIIEKSNWSNGENRGQKPTFWRKTDFCFSYYARI